MPDESSILIIGAKGQLGSALKQKYPRAKAVDSDELDITNSKAVKTFDWTNVSVILNPAAYTNVDGAETPEGRIAAWKINVMGIANLVREAIERDLLLVHVSTDYVFDGNSKLHSEDEPFSPLSVYGATKATSDVLVSIAPKHYIVRTSWLIGDGKNFIRTMLEVGRKGINPKVVNDQIGRLTFTAELVKGINHLLSKNAEFGTYNLTNSGEPASWADITRELYKIADLDITVTGISTEAYFKDKPEAAKRPLNSTLDLKKIESTGFHPADWVNELKNYVKEAA